MSEEKKSSAGKCACPYCDTTIDQVRFPFCGSCGAELMSCPSCGQETAKKETSCSHCGAKISK